MHLVIITDAKTVNLEQVGGSSPDRPLIYAEQADAISAPRHQRDDE